MTFFASQEGVTPEEYPTEAEAEARAMEMASANGRPATAWEEWDSAQSE